MQSLVSPGNGVPRIQETKVTPTEKQPGQPGAEVKLAEDGKWYPEASYQDQYARFPGTTKESGIKIKTFALPTDEDALNELLAYTEPYTAPRFKLEGGLQREFHEGKFYVLVSYREISYLKIIPKRP
jgi:hypothetical protein